MTLLHASQLPLAAAVAMAVSAIAIAVLSRVAPAWGLVDRPGGRKAHAQPVPLVGGLGILLGFASTWAILGEAGAIAWFMAAILVVTVVGLWDDMADIRPRYKIAIQVLACALMIWGAGVQLRSVGDLLGWGPIGLGLLAIPLTMFAAIGVVNAVNMIDGIDGLAGAISFVAFTWYALIALDSGLLAQSLVAVTFAGAIAGFLLFNLRLPWQAQARAFLGDAGSLMAGFALGWLAIDLTQGDGRTFPPINALWIVMLPLCDCVSLMARRLRAGRSPFSADRQHIHHYLLARGFTPQQTLAILVGLSTAFGAVGYFAWLAEVPAPALFAPFFIGYFTYHFCIRRAWRGLEASRTTGAVSDAPA